MECIRDLFLFLSLFVFHFVLCLPFFSPFLVVFLIIFCFLFRFSSIICFCMSSPYYFIYYFFIPDIFIPLTSLCVSCIFFSNFKFQFSVLIYFSLFFTCILPVFFSDFYFCFLFSLSLHHIASCFSFIFQKHLS